MRRENADLPAAPVDRDELPELPVPARALTAASWSWLSSVVRTGVPARPPGELQSLDTLCPAAFTTTTEVVGVPSSSFWKVCS